MSQENEILKYLQTGKSITPLEALRLFGTMRLSGRIFDLKAKGHKIAEMDTHINGKTFARYFLVQEETAPVQEREINYSEVDKQLVIF